MALIILPVLLHFNSFYHPLLFDNRHTTEECLLPNTSGSLQVGIARAGGERTMATLPVHLTS